MNNHFGNTTEEEILNFYQNISKIVRNVRQKKGISQLDLALEIGIKSIAFYSNCKSCRYGKHFNLEHLYKISKALDVDICSFFKYT